MFAHIDQELACRLMRRNIAAFQKEFFQFAAHVFAPHQTNTGADFMHPQRQRGKDAYGL